MARRRPKIRTPRAAEPVPETKAAAPSPAERQAIRRRWAIILAVLCALIFLPPRTAPLAPSPERPDTVFLDKAGLVAPAFARDTSRRLYAIQLFEGLVYIDSDLPPGELSAWTQQAATDWKVGLQHQDRGLVLFIFPKARTARVEVGYGLEGQLPDLRLRQLLETHLLPAMTRGQPEQGIEAFIEAVYAALGGDRAWAEMAHANAGRGKAGWGELWGDAWRNGAALLPAVWGEYQRGSPLERFILLVLAAPVTAFALLAAVALYALQDTLRQRVAGWRQGRPLLPATGREWFEVGLGLAVASLCVPIFVFVFAMGPEWLTRLGRFGGAGVSLTWPVG